MHIFKCGLLLMGLSVSQTIYAEFTPMRVETGGRISCALSNQGSVKCWGYNFCYELATGDDYSYGFYPNSMGVSLPSAKFGTNVLVKDICAGGVFACVATTDGKVKCWGNNWNKYGSLGQGHSGSCQRKYGDSLPYTDLGADFYAENISCGTYHACATNPKGQTKCWGMNQSGELGIGDRITRGNGSDQMGDNLPFLASSKPFQLVAPAGAHTCALIDNQIKCWGYGDKGTLGNGSSETLVVRNIDAPKPVLIVAPGENIKIRKITSLREGNCVLYKLNDQDRDHVKCWGSNAHGSLGIGDTSPRGNTVGSMGARLPEVDTGFDHIADIQGHSNFVCVLSTKGQVKCWGNNEFGQLGLGHTTDKGGAPNDMGQNLSVVNLGLPAKAISAGGTTPHSCAILINNQMKCWGYNESGQLGYEDGVTRGTSPGDMGDYLPFVRLN